MLLIYQGRPDSFCSFLSHQEVSTPGTPRYPTELHRSGLRSQEPLRRHGGHREKPRSKPRREQRIGSDRVSGFRSLRCFVGRIWTDLRHVHDGTSKYQVDFSMCTTARPVLGWAARNATAAAPPTPFVGSDGDAMPHGSEVSAVSMRPSGRGVRFRGGRVFARQRRSRPDSVETNELWYTPKPGQRGWRGPRNRAWSKRVSHADAGERDGSKVGMSLVDSDLKRVRLNWHEW